MNTTLIYGLILGIGNILLTLLGYFLGYQTDKISESGMLGFITFFLFVLILWLGVRAVREAHPQQTLSYGQGVASGMLVATYGSLLSAIYIFLHFTFIHPSYPDYAIPAQLAQVAASSSPPESLEAAEKDLRMRFTPIWQAVGFFGFSLISSLIVSLITAAFLKQEPTVDKPA